MRKVTSALLIFILFFNLFGYRLVIDFMQERKDLQLEARLDKNRFDESRLIELKIPINLPYQTSWSNFERYDGEVELNGVLYKYVKRKISNDTLVLLCIPNQDKMNLQSAKDEFFKNSNDLAQNNSKKSGESKTIAFKKLLSEYDDHAYKLHSNVININQQDFNFTYISASLLSTAHISPEQPPDNTCA